MNPAEIATQAINHNCESIELRESKLNRSVFGLKNADRVSVCSQSFRVCLLVLLIFVCDPISPLKGEVRKHVHTREQGGEVRYFEPGRWIGIVIRYQVEQTYNLRSEKCSYQIDPNVRVGSDVLIEEEKDEFGKKVVSIHVKR